MQQVEEREKLCKENTDSIISIHCDGPVHISERSKLMGTEMGQLNPATLPSAADTADNIISVLRSSGRGGVRWDASRVCLMEAEMIHSGCRSIQRNTEAAARGAITKDFIKTIFLSITPCSEAVM